MGINIELVHRADPQVLLAVREAAARYDVDPVLAQAVCLIESGGRMVHGEGPSGEIGVMQVTPAAGDQIGVALGLDSTLEQQAEAGVAYIAWLENQVIGHSPSRDGTHWPIRAYNAGPHGADNGSGYSYWEKVRRAIELIEILA